MDRDRLVRVLSRDGEAFAACRRAVEAGALIRVWDTGTPASELATTYARRLRLVQRRGTPEVGFADAVRAPRAHGDRTVRLGAVELHDPPWHFQLFVDMSGTGLVACLGVDQRWKTPA